VLWGLAAGTSILSRLIRIESEHYARSIPVTYLSIFAAILPLFLPEPERVVVTIPSQPETKQI